MGKLFALNRPWLKLNVNLQQNNNPFLILYQSNFLKKGSVTKTRVHKKATTVIYKRNIQSQLHSFSKEAQFYTNKNKEWTENIKNTPVFKEIEAPPFWNVCFDKSRLKSFLFWSFKKYGQKKTIFLLEKLQSVGFGYATKAGISLSVDDLKIPPTKTMYLAEAETTNYQSLLQYKKAQITALERFQSILDTWNRTSEILKDEMVKNFKNTDVLNPVFMMAFSGARGNVSQVRQLVAMRGLMADPQGNLLSFPIRSNFREGLTLTEYVISCYGARKGVVDTALRTANAGYLTRRLVDVAHHVIVSHLDCGTNRGIQLAEMKQGNKVLFSLRQRLLGRVLAAPIKVTYDFKKTENKKDLQDLAMDKKRPEQKDQSFFAGRFLDKNQEISEEIAHILTSVKKLSKVWVRSPLTCETKRLVCQLCYGWSLSEGQLVAIGEAVGILAAQSIGEPGTQLTMRTFHTGGVFSGEVLEVLVSPIDAIVHYSLPIPGTLVRNSHGQIAFLTKNNGELKLAYRLSGTNPNEAYKYFKTYQLPPYFLLQVRNGENVVKGQVLAEFGFFSGKGRKAEVEKAEYTVYSEIEGNVYFYADIIKKSFFNSVINESLNWGSIWILAGKIGILKYNSSFFPFAGDLVNKNSTLARTQWRYSPRSGYLSLDFIKKRSALKIDQNKNILYQKYERDKNQTSLFSSKSSIFEDIPLFKKIYTKKWNTNEKNEKFNLNLIQSEQIVKAQKVKKFLQTNFVKGVMTFKTTPYKYSPKLGLANVSDSVKKRGSIFEKLEGKKSNSNFLINPLFTFSIPILSLPIKTVFYKKRGYIFSIYSTKLVYSSFLTLKKNNYYGAQQQALLEQTGAEQEAKVSLLKKEQYSSKRIFIYSVKQKDIAARENSRTPGIAKFLEQKNTFYMGKTHAFMQSKKKLFFEQKKEYTTKHYQSSNFIFAQEQEDMFFTPVSIGYSTHLHFQNKSDIKEKKEPSSVLSGSSPNFLKMNIIDSSLKQGIHRLNSQKGEYLFRKSKQLTKNKKIKETLFIQDQTSFNGDNSNFLFQWFPSFSKTNWGGFFNWEGSKLYPYLKYIKTLALPKNEQLFFGNEKNNFNAKIKALISFNIFTEKKDFKKDASFMHIGAKQFKYLSYSKQNSSFLQPEMEKISQLNGRYLWIPEEILILKKPLLEEKNTVLSAGLQFSKQQKPTTNIFQFSLPFFRSGAYSYKNPLFYNINAQGKYKPFILYSPNFGLYTKPNTFKNIADIQHSQTNSSFPDNSCFSNRYRPYPETNFFVRNISLNTETNQIKTNFKSKTTLKKFMADKISKIGKSLFNYEKFDAENFMVLPMYISLNYKIEKTKNFSETELENFIFKLLDQKINAGFGVSDSKKINNFKSYNTYIKSKLMPIKPCQQYIKNNIVEPNQKNTKKQNSISFKNGIYQTGVFINQKFLESRKKCFLFLVDSFSLIKTSTLLFSSNTNFTKAPYQPNLNDEKSSSSLFKTPRFKQKPSSYKYLIKKVWFYISFNKYFLQKQRKSFENTTKKSAFYNFDISKINTKMYSSNTIYKQTKPKYNLKPDHSFLYLKNFNFYISPGQTFMDDIIFDRNIVHIQLERVKPFYLTVPLNKKDFLKFSTYSCFSSKSYKIKSYSKENNFSNTVISTINNKTKEDNLYWVCNFKHRYKFLNNSVKEASFYIQKVIEVPMPPSKNFLKKKLSAVDGYLKNSDMLSSRLRFFNFFTSGLVTQTVKNKKETILTGAEQSKKIKLHKLNTMDIYNKQKKTFGLHRYPDTYTHLEIKPKIYEQSVIRSEYLYKNNKKLPQKIENNSGFLKGETSKSQKKLFLTKTGFSNLYNKVDFFISPSNTRYFWRSNFFLSVFIGVLFLKKNDKKSFSKKVQSSVSLQKQQSKIYYGLRPKDMFNLYIKGMFGYLTKFPEILSSLLSYLNWKSNFIYEQPSELAVQPLKKNISSFLYMYEKSAKTKLVLEIKELQVHPELFKEFILQKYKKLFWSFIGQSSPYINWCFIQNKTFGSGSSTIYSLENLESKHFYLKNLFKSSASFSPAISKEQLTFDKTSVLKQSPTSLNLKNTKINEKLNKVLNTLIILPTDCNYYGKTSSIYMPFLSPYNGEIYMYDKKSWWLDNGIRAIKGTKQKNYLICTKEDQISYSLDSFYNENQHSFFLENNNKKNLNTDFAEENSTTEKKSVLKQQPFRNILAKPVFLGDFVLKGETLKFTQEKALPHAYINSGKSGQIIHRNRDKITIRKGEPLLFSPNCGFHVYNGDFIEKKTPVLSLPYKKLKTGDIVQGIPKIEQLFEARYSLAGKIQQDSLPKILNTVFQNYKYKLSLAIAVRKSFQFIQILLINSVQRIYRLQGVNISDKHLEIVIRQMTSKVKIINRGNSGFLRGEEVDYRKVEAWNKNFSSKKFNSYPSKDISISEKKTICKVRYKPIILGISKASLEVDSFLSAASFQHTTRVLSKAAFERKVDFLNGLKENIIIGNIIPAGTGFLNI